VDDFQAGKIDVLVCTFGVGSVGITLTTSRRVILMDRPWTPGDVMQAEDRIRRIGQQHKELLSYWVTAFEFDDYLDTLLDAKRSKTQKVLSKGRHVLVFYTLFALNLCTRKGCEFSGVDYES
jgi:SNF2 family DNA or RNA helicase